MQKIIVNISDNGESISTEVGLEGGSDGLKSVSNNEMMFTILALDAVKKALVKLGEKEPEIDEVAEAMLRWSNNEW